MTSVSQAALAASVLVGLVSIPAVSKTAVPQETETSEIPEVTDQETGREVVKSVSPDGFQAKISTAFEEFMTNVNSEEANATLETPTSDLQMKKTSQGTRWKLSTSRGSLEIHSTHDKVIEKTETPQGTLKLIQHDGTTTRKFRGANRTAVERSRAKLKQMMEKKKEELDSKRKTLKKDYRIIVKINESLASGFVDETYQHAVLINQDTETVNLEGWTVEDADGNQETLPAVEVEPGESLKLYSNSEDDVGEEENSVYGIFSAWTNSGDEIRLYNTRGDLVAESSF